MEKIKVLEKIVHDTKDVKIVNEKSGELGYYIMLDDFFEAKIILDENNSFNASVFVHSNKNSKDRAIDTIRKVNGENFYGLYRIAIF